jgi:Na+/H+-dicarboxylate symporter
MTKLKLGLAWQILFGLILGIAVGVVLNHYSSDKRWWIATVLQPVGELFVCVCGSHLAFRLQFRTDGLPKTYA